MRSTGCRASPVARQRLLTRRRRQHVMAARKPPTLPPPPAQPKDSSLSPLRAALRSSPLARRPLMLGGRRAASLAGWVALAVGALWLGAPLLQPFAPACRPTSAAWTPSHVQLPPSVPHNGVVTQHPKISANARDIALLACWSGELSEAGKQSITSKKEYAQYWDYDLHVSVNEPMTGGKQGSWNKIFALRRLMRVNPQTEWFWVSDADLVIMNPALTIEEHILQPLNLVPGYTNDTSTYLIIGIDCNCINAGSLLIRNIPEAYLFLDLLLDPLLHELPYGEQDSMSHILSHHPILLSKTALVPLRMLNAYPPSSCPISEAAYGPANGEWDPALNIHTRVLPGYEYGTLDTLGWNVKNPTQNWWPIKKQIQVVDQFGQPVETREQTPEEADQEYRQKMKDEGRPYDPLILREEGKPPASSPGTRWSISKPMSKEEKDKVEWQWWHDPRLRYGKYHYMPGDFAVHLAGCWLVEGQCEATWSHYFAERTKTSTLPKTRSRLLKPAGIQSSHKSDANTAKAKNEDETAQLTTVPKQSTLDDPNPDEDETKREKLKRFGIGGKVRPNAQEGEADPKVKS